MPEGLYDSDFQCSKFSASNNLFLAYRLVAFTYWLAWIIMNWMIDFGGVFEYPMWHDFKLRRSGWKHFCYLTNWTALLLLAYLGVALYTCLRPKNLQMRKWHLFLYHTVADCAFLVTLLYWGLLVDYRRPYPPALMEVHVHGVNFTIILIEVALSRLPFMFHHMIYAIVYMLFYTLFNLCYVMAGGTSVSGKPYIYGFLNWKGNLPYAIFIVCFVWFVAIPGLHTLLWTWNRVWSLCKVHIDPDTSDGNVVTQTDGRKEQRQPFIAVASFDDLYEKQYSYKSSSYLDKPLLSEV